SIGETLADTHSRDGTLSSIPGSESASTPWSGDDSMDSSEDDYMPPSRRFPPFAPPGSLQMRARSNTPGNPLLGSAEFSSRHSQNQHLHLHLHPRPANGSNARPRTFDINPAWDSSDDVAQSISTDEERREVWRKVEDQRQKLRHLRRDMADKRKEVHDLRRRKAEVDNAFMQTIRPHLTSSQKMAVIPTETIGKRFGEMQRIRDDYYAAESAYEAMESELEAEEAELQMLEGNLFRLLYDQAGMSPQYSSSAGSEDEDDDGDGGESDDDDDGADDDSSLPTSLLGISGDRPEDVHPLYRDLVDAAGDRELAREHHDELCTHRNKILYDIEMKLHRERVRNNKSRILTEEELRSLRTSLAHVPTDAEEFRAKFGVPISKYDLEFLRDYAHDEEQVRRKLEETTAEVDRLRELCMQKAVMRKHASYNEEFTIFSGSSNRGDFPPPDGGGNMTLDLPPRKPGDLSHPRFPILLSNPSHYLELMSPMAALKKAMKLPRDDPDSGPRRAECIKELGIDNLMKKVDSKPDYINQWLIHRLRTSPMEAELMYSISESKFRIVNVRRWQEEVLLNWRRDEAAVLSPLNFQGPQTPKD
ncbi:hypothetical protein QBC46DRAFT_236874, partial [Diplogelasinospora grovesii]